MFGNGLLSDVNWADLCTLLSNGSDLALDLNEINGLYAAGSDDTCHATDQEVLNRTWFFVSHLFVPAPKWEVWVTVAKADHSRPPL
jgi:hypothetical protein